jgi:hypothetical protein
MEPGTYESLARTLTTIPQRRCFIRIHRLRINVELERDQIHEDEKLVLLSNDDDSSCVSFLILFILQQLSFLDRSRYFYLK